MSQKNITQLNRIAKGSRTPQVEELKDTTVSHATQEILKCQQDKLLSLINEMDNSLPGIPNRIESLLNDQIKKSGLKQIKMLRQKEKKKFKTS